MTSVIVVVVVLVSALASRVLRRLSIARLEREQVEELAATANSRIKYNY